MFSCTSKTYKSFYLLNDAFENWYKNNHMTNINYYNKGYHYYNDFYYTNSFKEYINDLKRFQLELSQLDIGKNKSMLSEQYFYLKHLINNLLIINSDSEIIDDPYLLLYDNYYSIYSIIENESLMMNEKIDLLFHAIDRNIKNIQFIIDNKNKYRLLDKNIFSNESQIYLNYLNYVPIKVSSDINTLDSLDNKIKYLKKSFLEFKESNLYITQPVEILNDKKIIYSKYIQENISTHIDYNDKVEHIMNNYKNYNSKLFNKCLKFYLIENDEPVWVDETDSLNVIKWVLENKIFTSTINNDKIISNYYKTLNEINTIISTDLNALSINKLPLIFKKDYDLNLFRSKSFTFNDNIFIDIDNKDYNFNKYSIFSDLTLDIINSFYDRNNVKFKGVVNDKSYQNALSRYLRSILLNDEFFNQDELYGIIDCLDILRTIVLSINQHNLFNDNTSKDKIISNLIKYGYYHKDEAVSKYKTIASLNNFYIFEYMYFDALINKKIDISHFQNALIKGNIPIYMIDN